MTIDINNPFEIVKNINTKSGHIDLENKSIPTFVINKTFGNTLDSLIYASECNKFSIDDSQMLYDFYYFALPKRKRFGKYNKKSCNDDLEFINAIKEIYNYSDDKARDVIDLLLPYKKEIMQFVYRGGRE